MRMGHGEVLDHMFTDGLQSAWDGKLMGCFADATSEKYGFTREAQDAYATESVRRAQAANNSGAFAKETVAVRAKSRKGEVVVDKDESPFTLDVAKIATLKPAFGKNGTVTAASSSSIADGASALIMTRESTAKQRNLKPVARLLGHASFAREPEWFTLAPAGAIQLALKQAGWSTKEVDLYEINEAFAAVTMAAMKDLSLDHATVNVNGGACALGHPVGATGARITTTLIHALAARGLKRGVAALCIGGGEATAIALELI
jgi:acetyl-CoA C-acetyltransferase